MLSALDAGMEASN